MAKKPTIHPSSGAKPQKLGTKPVAKTKRDVVADYAQQTLAQIALWEERGEVVPLDDLRASITAFETEHEATSIAKIGEIEAQLEEAKKSLKEKEDAPSFLSRVDAAREGYHVTTGMGDTFESETFYNHEGELFYNLYAKRGSEEHEKYWENPPSLFEQIFGNPPPAPPEGYNAAARRAQREQDEDKRAAKTKVTSLKANKTKKENELQTRGQSIMAGLNALLDESDQHASTLLINKELAKYAADNSTDLGAMAEALPVTFTKLITGQFAMRDIEQLLSDAALEAETPEERALKQFVNHAMIPSLQYYVIRGTINQLAQSDGKSLTTAEQDYPNIRAHAHEMVDLKKAVEVQPRVDALTEPPVDFSDLMNSSTGSHTERMESAMEKVAELTESYEEKFKSLQGRFEEIVNTSVPNLDQRIKDMTAASDKRRGQLQHSAELADMRSEAMGTAIEKTYGQKDGGYQFGKVVTYIAPAVDAGLTTLGLPTFGAVTHAASRIPNVERYGDDVRGKLRAKLQEAYNEAHKAVIEGKLNVLSEDDKRIAVLANELVELEAELGINQTEQGQARDAAVSEALIAKYVLSFGMHMSRALDSAAKDHGFDAIDDYLEALEASDRRLGEAVSNLAYGFADSNDVAVILAEANSVSADSSKEVKALAEFAEDVLKPNIADVLSHASKVDVIYQTNLTGLGTPFHATRNSVHAENSARVAALFSDAFGVTSALQELTTHGATDVKRLFDFYLHRHGSEFISDAKIHDGIEKMPKTEKAVSVLPHRELRHHVESTKAAQGYRREAPDISDMFVRICAYEYVYPQAPNSAGKENIMTETPQGPAAYVMVNKVVNEFVERLSQGPIEAYREQVGPELDALIAQTFIDFFQEVGRSHAADTGISNKTEALMQASKETSTHGFAFDDFCRHVTKSAEGQFDTFLEIYARNLEKTLETAPKEVAEALEAQIDAIESELKETLKGPNITRPNTQHARDKARDNNHTLENVSWRGSGGSRSVAV